MFYSFVVAGVFLFIHLVKPCLQVKYEESPSTDMVICDAYVEFLTLGFTQLI